MIKVHELFDVGDIIRVLRTRAGIKGAKAIKKQLGINKATLSRIENTSRYKRESIEKMAPRLGTSLAEILAVRDFLKNGKAAPSADYICPQQIPEHISYHEKLEECLHHPNADIGNAVIFGLLGAYGAMPPEDEKVVNGRHGPYGNDRRPGNR